MIVILISNKNIENVFIAAAKRRAAKAADISIERLLCRPTGSSRQQS
ncbi:MAG: hypothetical protein LBM87_03145 [Ruminococcus sp.]|nr:hypothetical protein [Ruminococcus sp.]